MNKNSMVSFAETLNGCAIVFVADMWVIAWNNSLTLRFFVVDHDSFDEVDVRTLQDAPVSVHEAKIEAEKWLVDVMNSLG
jgi:hypothetical protein